MGLSRQEYWSELPCPPPGDPPNPCLFGLLHWHAGSLPLAPLGEPLICTGKTWKSCDSLDCNLSLMVVIRIQTCKDLPSSAVKREKEGEKEKQQSVTSVWPQGRVCCSVQLFKRSEMLPQWKGRKRVFPGSPELKTSPPYAGGAGLITWFGN